MSDYRPFGIRRRPARGDAAFRFAVKSAPKFGPRLRERHHRAVTLAYSGKKYADLIEAMMSTAQET